MNKNKIKGMTTLNLDLLPPYVGFSDEEVVGGEPPERPTFSTNIFDGRDEPEPEPELQQEQEPSDAHHWFWLSIVIAIFFFGVAASYYIIHNF